MKKKITTPTHRVGKRKHGFRRRMKSASGRAVLRRRRKKGRARIAL